MPHHTPQGTSAVAWQAAFYQNHPKHNIPETKTYIALNDQTHPRVRMLAVNETRRPGTHSE